MKCSILFFRHLARTVVIHTPSAHHCLYLFALTDSMNLCVSYRTTVGENPSWGNIYALRPCMHAYLHLHTLHSLQMST